VSDETTDAAETAEERRARHAALVSAHAPPDWRDRFDADALLAAIEGGEPIQMFVMAADIRGSTMLMKEAIRIDRFAFVMDKFVTTVRQGIGRYGGWFDKFTGDGFLAYWVVQSAEPDEYEERFVQTAGDIAHTANILIDLFHRRVLEDFRSNSRNLSSGVGLSMGLDAGPGYLVKIADELTIVGPPVVGSVRMVTAAALPKEIVANVFLGERLREGQDGVYEALGVRVSREFRPTKEYPRGQEVYALTFEQDGSELETSDEDAEIGTDVVDVSDATGDGDGKAS
jgi:class 3 adenylate cyclase